MRSLSCFDNISFINLFSLSCFDSISFINLGRNKLSQKAPYKAYHLYECYEREKSRINRLERQDEIRVHEQDAI
jgi:hypothetical protein